MPNFQSEGYINDILNRKIKRYHAVCLFFNLGTRFPCVWSVLAYRIFPHPNSVEEPTKSLCLCLKRRDSAYYFMQVVKYAHISASLHWYNLHWHRYYSIQCLSWDIIDLYIPSFSCGVLISVTKNNKAHIYITPNICHILQLIVRSYLLFYDRHLDKKCNLEEQIRVYTLHMP